MKKFISKILLLTTIFATFASIPKSASAAQMYDAWRFNSWIGYNYTTQGGIVFAAQKMLNSAGMSVKVPGFNVSDGYFGVNTQNALIQYQSDYGLSCDGILGGDTWTELARHTVYTGNTGSIQNYKSQYNSSWAATYFQKDSYNGWCVLSSNGNYYLCNETFTYRSYVPL